MPRLKLKTSQDLSSNLHINVRLCTDLDICLVVHRCSKKSRNFSKISELEDLHQIFIMCQFQRIFFTKN